MGPLRREEDDAHRRFSSDPSPLTKIVPIIGFGQQVTFYLD